MSTTNISVSKRPQQVREAYSGAQETRMPAASPPILPPIRHPSRNAVSAENAENRTGSQYSISPAVLPVSLCSQAVIQTITG